MSHIDIGNETKCSKSLDVSLLIIIYLLGSWYYKMKLKDHIQIWPNLKWNKVPDDTLIYWYGTSTKVFFFVCFLLCQLDVCQMDEHIYHFRIHCKKSPGILVQLTRALEALEIDILNANLTSLDDYMLNTVVVEVNCDFARFMKNYLSHDLYKYAAYKFPLHFL